MCRNRDAIKANWDDKETGVMLEPIKSCLDSPIAQCRKVQEEAARVGFDWNDVQGPISKIIEETDELKCAIETGNTELAKRELGDVLLSVMNVARHMHVDPECVLSDATKRFVSRFDRMRNMLDSRGVSLCDCSMEEMDAAWELSKRHDTNCSKIDET